MNLRKTNVIVPSGAVFTVREMTGEDEDMLTNMASESHTVINTLMSRIVTQEGKHLSTNDIKGLLLRDKYCLLIQARILSLGPIMAFSYKWDSGNTEEYETDLNNFIWDYKEEFPEEGSPLYDPERFKPYSGKPMEKILSNGDKIRMDYLDGFGEEYLLKLAPAQRTINQQLIARNLHVSENGESYRPAKIFSNVPVRIMKEMRSLYEEFDPNFSAIVTVSNPQTGEVGSLSLLEIKDFFFPERI